jgi:hypothetical protein
MKTHKQGKRWGNRDFLFGRNLRPDNLIGGERDNLPGTTVGETRDGRPRSLDYRNFESVDWSLNDTQEDFS